LPILRATRRPEAASPPSPLIFLPPLLLVGVCALPTDVDPWARLALVLAAAATALALASGSAGAAGRRGFLLAGLVLPVLALSAVAGVDPALGRDRLLDFALYLIAFRAGRDLVGHRGRTGLLASLALVGGITGFHGLYQSWFSLPAGIRWLESSAHPDAALLAARMGSGRVFSTFLLPSAFAGFLLLSLPASLSLAARRGLSRGWRVLALVSAVAQAGALFLTYSRGAFLALFAGLVLLALGSGRSPTARRGALAAAALALVGLLVVAGVQGEALLGPGGALGERLGNWKVALAEIGARPLTGVGWGAYGSAYTLYQEPGMNQSRFAHNSYLQLGAEGGLLVLPLLAVFLAWAFARLARPAPGERAVALGVLATLLHNLVDFTFFLPGNALPFWLLAGALAARGAPPATGDSWARAGRVAALALAVALPAVALPATLARLDAEAARQAVIDGRPEEGRQRIRAALRLDPWKADYHDFLARWELEHGEPTSSALARGRSAALEAARLAPLTPHHHTTLEQVCAAQGDAACAFREASRAAALFPSSSRYRDRLQRRLAAWEAP
jgi:O-antigen ligase